MMKVINEWVVSVPWGKIALISWGNPNGEPILLVHGIADSAATFIPILNLLPESYYYVGMDSPGHGKSDPFPIGVPILNFHFVQAVVEVVKHLGWKKFSFMSHSAGAVCTFFNSIYPNRVQKIILIDPLITFMEDHVSFYPIYFKAFFEGFYDDYEKLNFDVKVYSKRKALDSVMKARGLSEEQADLVLSRNMRKIGEDKYRLSWQRRIVRTAPLIMSNELLKEVISGNNPPILIINAKHNKIVDEDQKQIVNNYLNELQANNKGVYTINLDGGHDIHLTNPELIAPYVRNFLENNKLETISKL